MPTSVVDINLRSETGTLARNTYSDTIIVASEPTVASPTYNTPLVYDTADDVATDFGTDSDAHIASQKVENQGADSWWVVMLERTTHSETITDSDTSAVSSGTVANTPMAGPTGTVSISVDGTDLDVVATTDDPPTAPNSGEARYNPDTGDLKVPSPSSGSGAGIQVDYETNSWAKAKPEMDALDLELCLLADVRAGPGYIGDLDELLTWSSSHRASMITALENGSDYADDTEALAAAHNVAAYLPSGNHMCVAHKSSDDVAAAITGRISTKRPWFDPYWDGAADYGINTGYYRESMVGNPNAPGTFEGGDSNQDGPVNVLISQSGNLVMSNSLSTAGEGSNYQYFDVRRTEDFVAGEARAALTGLRLRRDQIPFAPIGRTLIQDAIRSRLQPYVATGATTVVNKQNEQNEDQEEDQGDTEGEQQKEEDERQKDQEEMLTEKGNTDSGVPLGKLTIQVPRIDQLGPQARGNRVWENIRIEGRLASNVHTFSVDLSVKV